jgi:hypothetical protein
MDLSRQSKPIIRDGNGMPAGVEKTVVPSNYKGPCYFHHSCPADGYIGTMTKRQCRNYQGAHSWKNQAGGCENF